jgi:glutathione S-transferase
MLTLYFVARASSMAPHIALHEVGADFDARPISFRHREHRAPAYLALNPEGKVPTLLIDGRPLTRSGCDTVLPRASLSRRWPVARGCGGRGSRGFMDVFRRFHVAPRAPKGTGTCNDRVEDSRPKLGTQNWVTGRYYRADIHLF